MIKAFLTRSLYFMLPVLLALGGIGFLADGYTDPFYLKLASPKQTALIVGISRAEQGLQPRILDSLLRDEYPHVSLYNFAFTLHGSPYGKVYLDAIKHKLKEHTSNSLFIVTVEPWTIARFAGETDEAPYRESNSFLATTKWINTHPDFSYLAQGYTSPYLHILTRKINTALLHRYPEFYLHDDGWLEATRPMDSASVAARINATIDTYEKLYLPSCSISPMRKYWLLETIRFLKAHGDVYLVRLPVHPSLLATDNKMYPQFDAYIDSLARRQHIPYYNFTDSAGKYTYTDGSHLWKTSGAQVSEALSRLIINTHSR